MKTFATTALCTIALLSAGGAMAQQHHSMQPLIEGVPAMMSPMAHDGSENARAEVRNEAQLANAAGDADRGGLVASELGRQDDSGQPAQAMTRDEVQAQARGQTTRIGGEADDIGA